VVEVDLVQVKTDVVRSTEVGADTSLHVPNVGTYNDLGSSTGCSRLHGYDLQYVCYCFGLTVTVLGLCYGTTIWNGVRKTQGICCS
jgi:hypothetical protein